MTNLKNAIIAIMVVIALVLVSCENDQLDTVVENTQVSELNTVQEDGSMFARRSGNDCNSNFVEEYIPLTGINILQTSSAVQVNANTFYFNTRVLGTFKGIYLKTYSPIGQVCYQKMEKSGSAYSISKSFYRSGTYYYKYLINTYGNKLVPIMSNSLSFDLELVIPSASDTYPYRTDGIDKWGFWKKQCVSYVAYKVNEMWGTSTDFRNDAFSPRLGNAITWKSTLENYGYKADNNPQPGDIAWWRKVGTPESNQGGFNSDGTSRGHVAFVHTVYPDKSIEITEYNWSPPEVYHHVERLYPWNSRYPHAFIHIQFQR